MTDRTTWNSWAAKRQELQWCKAARIKRAQTERYFGTLAPESTNSALSVWRLYR